MAVLPSGRRTRAWTGPAIPQGEEPHTVASAVEHLHADALTEFGPVDGELLALALMERRAGITLRPGAAATTPPDRPA